MQVQQSISRNIFLFLLALQIGLFYPRVAVAYVSAQSATSNSTQEKTRSPEELEADKLNSEVVQLFREKKYQEALPLAKRALVLREQKLGAEHQATQVSMLNLAAVHSYLNQHKNAIELYQNLLKIREKLYGPTDLKLADILSKLGWERVATNNDNAAESLFKRHLQIREKAYGVDHPDTLVALNDLALVNQRTGDLDEAIGFYRRMIAIYEKNPADNDLAQAKRLVKCAALLRLKNKDAEAADLEARARAIYAARNSTSKLIKAPDLSLPGDAIFKVQPEYPSSAKQSRVQGTVEVSIVIDEAGIVTDATAISGPIELRRPAIEAAKKWRFTPVELEGTPAKVQGILTFHFTLQ